MAKLTVVDSGIGIDASHLVDIFEMFKQVEAGPNRRRHGLGIGLALVKQLTTLQGGRVEALSNGLGQGTQFTVWLPLMQDEESRPSVAADNDGLNGVKLLVIDDESDFLSALGSLLQHEGAQTTLVERADRALELARQERFDAVISDIAMPELDGYWLAARLREDAVTRNLALIAVSGMARDIDRILALEAGFDAHVGKPINMEQLVTEIHDALKTRRQSALR
jgi:two-component system CheB/CheR fusion protein